MRLPLLAALLVTVPALAGCASEAPVTTAQADAPVIVTSPTDYAYLDDADVGAGAHLHDYWGGAETLVVMEATQPFNTIFHGGHRAEVFRPDGAVVPQGAASVEVTLTWSDSPEDTYTAPELWVKTAADNEAVSYGAVQSGVPIVVPSDNDKNDLPHQGLTAWEFHFRVHDNAAGWIVFQSEVHLLARALRGLDIPLYPAHPDRWDNATELALLDETVELFVFEGHAAGSYNCFGGCPVVHIPVDGAIVPPETRIVEVRLTMGENSATQLGLDFHGADTRELTRLAPTRTEGATRIYEIQVERGSADGPYAKQSLWELVPYISAPVEDGWHAGSYRIEAKAIRA